MPLAVSLVLTVLLISTGCRDSSELTTAENEANTPNNTSIKLPKFEDFPELEAAWTLALQKEHLELTPEIFPLRFEATNNADLLTASELLSSSGDLMYLELLPPNSTDVSQQLSWAAYFEKLLSKITQIPMGEFTLPQVFYKIPSESVLPTVSEDTFFTVEIFSSASALQTELCEKAKGWIYAGQLLAKKQLQNKATSEISRGRRGNEISLVCRLRTFAAAPSKGPRMLLSSLPLPIRLKESSEALFQSRDDLSNLAKLQLLQEN